ncbi:acyl-CoA dehydrogenase family protein [Roseomonas populi]|uniref:Acyl-CoA/acyl-ACP dehydrogenase n=1 Tax=Roseomonas populi TaxID=3121582 RepID=A0ABT1X3C9_9PROT|nr:acyl-CoA dehydrogenase family protein [Roseomonas pecuniae]MCR0982598.1 acyl-CoA/acyl-ACP dehydrogenase [Roseomonas pecuniae]
MIDFAPDETQLAILDSVDRFLQDRLPPDEIRRRDAGHVPPYDLLPALGELGLFRLAVPEEEGGLGLDWRTVMLVQERLGRHAYMVASIFNRVVGFGIASVKGYGSAAQRAALMPKLLEGRLLIALALTEPEAGTDASAIRTRAMRVEGGWRIRGRKTWISDAKGADYLLVAARTDPESSGSRGISLFLVPPTAEGVAMTPLSKVGNNCMPSWDIGFDDVFVPDHAMMGQEGQGFRHMMSTLHNSRASMAATVTGCAQAAVDCALAHAKERVQFGRPLGALQSVRHRLADMQMRVDQSRLTVWHLGWLIATGQKAQREASAAKVIATETLQYVTHHGMQILASAGYSSESDMQRFWRDGRLYTFGEGANEIQREIIAREMGL